VSDILNVIKGQMTPAVLCLLTLRRNHLLHNNLVNKEK